MSVPVNRGGGREDDPFDVMGLHDFAEGKGGIQIIAEITQRLGNAFPDGLQAGKVNHAINTVFRKDPVKRGFIRDIRLIVSDRMTNDLLNPAD